MVQTLSSAVSSRSMPSSFLIYVVLKHLPSIGVDKCPLSTGVDEADDGLDI